MRDYNYSKIILSIFVFMSSLSYSKIDFPPKYKKQKPLIANVAPVIIATGNQIYCKQTYQKIVTDITITDPDDTSTEAVYIQISSGYKNGQDQLTLTGLHPTITSSWDITTGKLKLYSPTGIPVSYVDLIAAIKDIEYTNFSATPSGIREFSISVGQANFLPSNGHYYQFVSNLGISWSDAKIAAENSTYYGLQGYLATITASDEALLVGEQASGTGWIGGTDEEQEGVWKWVTGPEKGTVFWNGAEFGSTPNFAFWNNLEPNNSQGMEDFAHITAPGVGILGSWNDLGNAGENSGAYQPKGYIVEYGGMPNDPVLEISSSTTITILSEPQLNTDIQICEGDTWTINAQFPDGSLNWYSDLTSTDVLFTGNTFTTTVLTQNTTFYYDYGCQSRNAIEIKVIPIPTIISTNNPITICAGKTISLEAITSSGNVNWYTSPTSNSILASGNSIVIPDVSKNSTYYAEAVDSGCSNKNRIPVTVSVYELPNVSDEELSICEGRTVTLNAGISNMEYLWSTGETTQTIRVNEPTNYSVIVTSPAPENCSITKKINIVQTPKPTIREILVSESEITILTATAGDFEYSIDGINYQNSNTFRLEKGGIYKAFVKDKNNCGKDSKSFVIITYPKFFTPNNDGENDMWKVAGMENFPNAIIEIFDRYGKRVAYLSRRNQGWNGNYNGRALPATDYWFVSKIDDSIPEKKGHFSLLR